MVNLEFTAGNRTLVFEILDNGIYWCTLYVVSSGKKIRLGANSFDTIKEKMLSTLKPPYQAKKGIINGVEVNAFTVVNLMGSLASILASPMEDSGLTLYLLPNNGFFPFMELKREDIEHLLSELESFHI